MLSSTRGRKLFFKMEKEFRQEDSIVDKDPCKCLGALLLNKISKHELEMVCGIKFRYGGARREVGVSVATVVSEESVKKLIGVLKKEPKKTIEPDLSVAATVFVEHGFRVRAEDLSE